MPETTGNYPVPGRVPIYDDSLVDAAGSTDVAPTYSRFDLNAGRTHPDGRISIKWLVNNVFNIAHPTSIISSVAFILRFFSPARTAGVRVRVAW